MFTISLFFSYISQVNILNKRLNSLLLSSRVTIISTSFFADEDEIFFSLLLIKQLVLVFKEKICEKKGRERLIENNFNLGLGINNFTSHMLPKNSNLHSDLRFLNRHDLLIENLVCDNELFICTNLKFKLLVETVLYLICLKGAIHFCYSALIIHV